MRLRAPHVAKNVRPISSQLSDTTAGRIGVRRLFTVVPATDALAAIWIGTWRSRSSCEFGPYCRGGDRTAQPHVCDGSNFHAAAFEPVAPNV
jgi:hypothetical protein